MKIFIDESGSFSTKNANYGSWNVVAAYVVPETETRKIDKCLQNLKISIGVSVNNEIKLKDIIDENNYFNFLRAILEFKGVLLATATDASLNLDTQVAAHQIQQVKSMVANIDRMKYESGKEGVRQLTSELGNLHIQLYMQLCCQIDLMYSFIERAIPYFIQRWPNSLRSFKWKIDQKNRTKTDFENAFEKFSPVLLQTLSIDKPTPMLSWCDYRPMKEYMYEKGGIPEYLTEIYSNLRDSEGYNIQKIMRKDINFVDSKKSVGIQIVDLMVSGLRRCLKHDFDNNEEAARLLGSIMLQSEKNGSPINLISYGDESQLDKPTSKLINIMIKQSKKLIKKS